MDQAAVPPAAVAIPLDQAESSAQTQPPQRIEIPIVVPDTRQCDASAPADGSGTTSADQQRDEIVVCAPDSAVFRTGAAPGSPDGGIPRAELKLSDKAKVAAELKSGNLGNTPTNRAMVTVTVAF